MAVFSYIALNDAGIEVRGVLNAAEQGEAIRSLRSKGWAPLEVQMGSALSKAQSRAKLLTFLNPFTLKKYAGVKPIDLTVLFRQLTLMIRAGYTVLEALEVAEEIVDKARLRNALREMVNDLQGGMSLSQAMLQHPKIFPSLAASLVASGEASGELDLVLSRISEDIDRREEVKRDLITAMIYPTIVLVLAVGIMVVTFTFTMPKIVAFLDSYDVELPALTQVMVDVTNWMNIYGLWLFVGFGGMIFLLLATYTFKQGKIIMDAVMLHLPLVGGLQRTANMASLGWILEMLLKSRITAMESMRIIGDVTPHSSYSRIYHESAEGMLLGDPLSAGLMHKEVPSMVRHLIEVGEKSGSLDLVMREIGSYYAYDLKARLKRIVAWIEPVMIIGIGGFVALIYFSIFSAVLKVVSEGI